MAGKKTLISGSIPQEQYDWIMEFTETQPRSGLRTISAFLRAAVTEYIQKIEKKR